MSVTCLDHTCSQGIQLDLSLAGKEDGELRGMAVVIGLYWLSRDKTVQRRCWNDIGGFLGTRQGQDRSFLSFLSPPVCTHSPKNLTRLKSFVTGNARRPCISLCCAAAESCIHTADAALSSEKALLTNPSHFAATDLRLQSSFSREGETVSPVLILLNCLFPWAK